MSALFPLGQIVGHPWCASCARESAAGAYILLGSSFNRGLGRTGANGCGRE